jgi:hypothetical protein
LSASRLAGEVLVADPGQQPDGPAADGQVNVGVAKADVARLVEGDLVVAGEPGQAGDGVVVELLHGEGHGPLDQPLHPCAAGGRWGAEW